MRLLLEATKKRLETALLVCLLILLRTENETELCLIDVDSSRDTVTHSIGARLIQRKSLPDLSLSVLIEIIKTYLKSSFDKI